ncbi:MAG: transglycosylase domain-containing protein [Deltaproteobacteria bacterium]|nr:transglycosylase domain-containing protein [Deltaproteobacteria bacterium]
MHAARPKAMQAPKTFARLSALALVATLLPWALNHHVRKVIRTRVAPALTRTVGEEVTIGDAELALLGTLRLSEVRVGTLLHARAMEGSVGLAHLMRGAFVADEIRVERPKVMARVTPSGTLDATRILTRVRDARRLQGSSKRGRSAVARPTAAPTSHLRRIIVTDGELVMTVDQRGEIRAREVELHPQEGGVRVVAAGVSLALRYGPWQARATFARTGFDVTIPELRVGRAAMDGGRVTLVSEGGSQVDLSRAVVSRAEAPQDLTRLEAHLADTGEKVKFQVLAQPGSSLNVDGELPMFPIAILAPALPAWVDAKGARAGGRFSARYDRVSGDLFVSMAADLKDLELAHRLLSPRPVPVEGKVQVDGSVHVPSFPSGPRRGTFRFSTGSVSLEADVDFATDEHGSTQRGHVVATLPETPCIAVISAIPRPLREKLDGLDVTGTLRGRAEVGFDLERPDEALLDVDLDVGCNVLKDAVFAHVPALEQPFTHVFPSDERRVMGKGDPAFVPLSRLPSHVTSAFVAGEDARFFSHQGFDEEQLRRSLAINLASRRVERGGSTISQQLVKNLYLSRERTLTRKLLEAVLTWRLESLVSKRRILEVYLNIIELGDGVYGIGPAAKRWFGKEPEKLTVAEAAFLAALTPAPLSTEKRLRKAGALDSQAQKRVEAVLRSMRVNRLLDKEAHARAKAERIEIRL